MSSMMRKMPARKQQPRQVVQNKKKQYGINAGNAMLRTMANIKSKSYAERRLLKDWKEIEKNPEPFVGVSVHPD